MASLTFEPTPSLAATRIGSLKSGGLQIEKAAEAADFGVRARPARRAHQRLDFLDHRIAGLDIDAGLGIGHLLFRRHFCPVSNA